MCVEWGTVAVRLQAASGALSSLRGADRFIGREYGYMKSFLEFRSPSSQEISELNNRLTRLGEAKKTRAEWSEWIADSGPGPLPALEPVRR